MKSETLVVPGDFLSTGEEYGPGLNTFEGSEGNIVSSTVGQAEFDEANREVRVKGKNFQSVEPGTTVWARVLLVKDSMVLLSILKAEKNGSPRVPHHPFAQLMVSKVANFFVKNLRDEFKIGDIVKAKVINVSSYSIEVTTAFPELGVVKAYCSRCRSALHLFGDSLKCLQCGTGENRKISMEYSTR